MGLFRGYLATKNKKPIKKNWQKSKLLTLEQAQELDEYAGVLDKDTINIDFDDLEEAEIVMNIIEDLQLNCKVNQTSRGKHFFFINDDSVPKCKTNATLACGLSADFKVGKSNCHSVLKYDGEERFCEWDTDELGKYDKIPAFLRPIGNINVDFTKLKEGDGRNQALFNHILTLQREGFTNQECRETIRIINQYILKDKLKERELETILRAEAFKKPAFFVKNTFLHDRFAKYLAKEEHIIKLNGQLHIYDNGVYIADKKRIEFKMIKHISILKDHQRREILKYLDVFLPNSNKIIDARYIAFNNGVLDLATDKMLDYSPDMIITNKLAWDYKPGSYNQLMDKTLDKFSCNDKEVRAVIEECVGYCFYRRNELGKAFILLGDKSNGKSTFLDIVTTLLGEDNVSSLDVQELGDKFSTAMMYNKLADVADDIPDDFMRGREIAVFKKVVTGNRIKGEYKGQDPFSFNPYVKLLCSANSMPRTKDLTGAVMRRLVIIPFRAKFSKDDPNFDPWIKYKLCEKAPIEYLIVLAVEGLKRVLTNKGFTECQVVNQELKEYERENNPILSFIDTVGTDNIINKTTQEVFLQWVSFCDDNGYIAGSAIGFGKQLKKKLNLKTEVRSEKGKSIRVYIGG